LHVFLQNLPCLATTSLMCPSWTASLWLFVHLY
jgi:hypothetical protein